MTNHRPSRGSGKDPPVPLVQVVIPTWNGASLLPYALDSLARQDYPNFTVVVVDNGSTDDTINVVRDRWPDVSVVALPENTGFAHAINCGIKAGTATLLALINNDVELHPSWMTEMVAAFAANPRAGSLAGRMLRWHDPSTVDNVGLYCQWDGDSGPAGSGAPNGAEYDNPGDVFGASAGAGMYRRAAFESVGYFDEDFFAYVEDVDWSFRAQLRGFRCRYVPGAISYHLGSSTSLRMGRRRFYLTVKNSFVMILKNFPFWALLRHSPRILWHFVSLAKASMRERCVGVYCRALAQVVQSLVSVIRQRRTIQRSRTASRTDLEAVVGTGRSFWCSVARMGRRRWT
jgi:GT2 family glycosyltransferase